MPFRTGSGYDVHRLVEGRPLVLGGIAIPHAQGLLGHSDADVLVHAVCDALLGAAGKGDIGQHFPDSNPEYKGISSLVLLGKTVEMLIAEGFSIANIDCTILAQAPKMSPYRKAMEKAMAETCGIDPERINVKATTTEGLGFAGRGEGIGAHATVLIAKKSGL